MRFLFAFLILFSVGAAAQSEGPQEGETTLASTWAHEVGANERSEAESAAAKFLKDVRPEEFQNTAKSKSGGANNQMTGHSTH